MHIYLSLHVCVLNNSTMNVCMTDWSGGKENRRVFLNVCTATISLYTWAVRVFTGQNSVICCFSSYQFQGEVCGTPRVRRSMIAPFWQKHFLNVGAP